MSVLLPSEPEELLDDDRDITVESILWQGILIEVRYEAKYLGLADTAHLSITSLSPDAAPLPITRTGYRSHFLDGVDVEVEGGPVAFVRRWLDAEVDSPEWREAQAEARQYALF
jgi:hypothetical protein